MPDIVDRPFAAAEGRVRESLASAHAEAKKRGRRLARYLAKHPIGCSLVAFAVGLAAARLLQRVD